MTHALVTGGAGFIGSHLVDALIERRAKVTVLDNLCNGRRSNLARWQDYRDLRFVELDIAQDDLTEHFSGVDQVFHLAALADIVPSIENPLSYHRSNVTGTVCVLEAARQAGVSRFVYAASSSCYGIPDRYPSSETAPCRPAYPYALTKFLGEQAVLHWAQVYGLPAISLRLFNVYGPRARTQGSYGAMFGTFLAQKLAGQPYTVVGDGEQSRDFTFVSDVVAAFVAAAESKRSGDVFNVGTGHPVSVNRIVELLGGEKIHVPKRPGEPDRTHADTAQISEKLGWRSQVSIEQGVQMLLDEIEAFRDAPVWTAEKISDATRSWFQYLGKHDSEPEPQTTSS